MSGRFAATLGAGATLFALLAFRPAAAVEVKDIYKAETIVTGTGVAERLRGFRETLAEVLVKASGDATLLGSASLARVSDNAADYVARYEQEDRMKGIPLHDEQGTRDRPYFLRVTFDKIKIDAALHALGVDIWPADRPEVAVWLGIKDAVVSYVLTETSERGYGQREALRLASRRRGVPIVLPLAADVEAAAITYDLIARGDVTQLRAATVGLGAEALLYGTLDYDGEGHWIVTWSVDWKGAERHWRQEHVTFDVGLRGGVEGAARVLAGLP
jgi:hypothetical protein